MSGSVAIVERRIMESSAKNVLFQKKRVLRQGILGSAVTVEQKTTGNSVKNVLCQKKRARRWSEEMSKR